MDPGDNFRERLEALEQQTQTLEAQTRTLERQLRWWRRLAGGFIVLAVLSLTWKPGTVADAQSNALADRFAAFQDEVTTLSNKLRYITAADKDGVQEVVITSANLRIVNGLGKTDCGPEDEPIPDCPNGLGNLIVGYNELRGDVTDHRTGSHNVVLGKLTNFSRFGGVVVAQANEINGD